MVWTGIGISLAKPSIVRTPVSGEYITLSGKLSSGGYSLLSGLEPGGARIQLIGKAA